MQSGIEAIPDLVIKAMLYYVYINELANDIQNSCKLLCELTDKKIHHTQIRNKRHYGVCTIVGNN